MKKIIVGFCSLLLLGLSAIAMGAPVDINTANAQTLATVMKGVGQKKAEAIVAYRKAHGPFKSLDELAKVKGISGKTVANNREKLMVGNAR